MSALYFPDQELLRLMYRRYRGWCIKRGYRWMPYRRWLTEEHVACWTVL